MSIELKEWVHRLGTRKTLYHNDINVQAVWDSDSQFCRFNVATPYTSHGLSFTNGAEEYAESLVDCFYQNDGLGRMPLRTLRNCVFIDCTSHFEPPYIRGSTSWLVDCYDCSTYSSKERVDWICLPEKNWQEDESLMQRFLTHSDLSIRTFALMLSKYPDSLFTTPGWISSERNYIR